ncbi:MAG: SDR family oxidoreductase [Pirellulales bacterium]|nr:SDR family oxidoreductase [Pirellulales bacterium]
MVRLIFGCGYLGHRVASRWLADGGDVVAVTRSARRAAEFQSEGLRPVLADVTRPDSLAGLPAADTVLYAIGYDRQSEASRHEVYADGLRAALRALPPETGRIIYVSSTGVYGDSEGRLVDEDSPCRPARQSGRAILAAEGILRSHAMGSRAVVLRLAGIYGPGRIPRLADLRSGWPLPISERAHLNLVHVDDAVAAVLAAESRGDLPALYNISDGHPCGRRDFYRRLAELLGLGEPQFVEPLAEEAVSERAGDKRVSNARMLSELHFALRYPSYREGLAAIVAAMG